MEVVLRCTLWCRWYRRSRSSSHIKQLVALPDELRETTLRHFKKLCDSCGCHNERELAVHLAEERG